MDVQLPMGRLWVAISGTNSTQTNSEGRFRVDNVGLGHHLGTARHASFDFTIQHCGELMDLGVINYPLIHPRIWPADSDLPAAGICAGPSSSPVVHFDINPDVPGPRCSKVANNQTLEFTNKTAVPVEVQLGDFNETLDPGATSTLFTLPVSSYLAPGVHDVHSSYFQGSGPEIWLTEPAVPAKPTE